MECNDVKTVELFYMPGCPYCVKAEKAIAQLKKENEIYADIPVKWINEQEETDYAEAHDYYYVPTLYLVNKKVFEAHPGDSFEKIRAGVKSAFDQAM